MDPAKKQRFVKLLTAMHRAFVIAAVNNGFSFQESVVAIDSIGMMMREVDKDPNIEESQLVAMVESYVDAELCGRRVV